jgi:MFS_1 like family
MPTYAKQLGFSSVVVGTLYTVLPIAGMVAKPLFGGIADRLKWHKHLFMLFLALTGILFFAINFTPSAESETLGPGVDLDCGSLTYLKSCRNNTDECALKKLEVNVGNSTVECHVNCPQVTGLENNTSKNKNLVDVSKDIK